MARRAVRLLLAVVLVAVLFNPDVAVEGKEEALASLYKRFRHWCWTCEVTRLDVANSPVNKVPAIGEIIGIAEKVCKPVQADDVLLVFEDEKWRCNEKCETKIKRGLLEAMKHYSGLFEFIYHNTPSIQKLKEFICEESPHSAEGEDDNESKCETTMKNIGRMFKEIPLWVTKLWQKEKPTNPAKACEKLKRFPEVKFYMTFRR